LWGVAHTYVGTYNILYVYKVPSFTKVNSINAFGSFNIDSLTHNVMSIIQCPFNEVGSSLTSLYEK